MRWVSFLCTMAALLCCQFLFQRLMAVYLILLIVLKGWIELLLVDCYWLHYLEALEES